MYDARSRKTKATTNGTKVFKNLFGLNVPDESVELESSATICIDSLLVYENK